MPTNLVKGVICNASGNYGWGKSQHIDQETPPVVAQCININRRYLLCACLPLGHSIIRTILSNTEIMTLVESRGNEPDELGTCNDRWIYGAEDEDCGQVKGNHPLLAIMKN